VNLKSASLICEQPILRGATQLTRSTVKLVCVDADTLAPCAIPTEIKEAIAREF
jgi:acyl-CoA thioesterase FadM